MSVFEIRKLKASLLQDLVDAFTFEYVICLDFEATCEEGERFSDAAEIIEIGAVLLNMRSGEIESEFHEYVRPTQRPILSEYCVNLTGITQDLISRQWPFPVAYQRFSAWLTSITNMKQLKFATPSNRDAMGGTNITFCTWTNYDLNHFFRLDCKRHGINPDYHFKAWIDARKLFEMRIRCPRMPFRASDTETLDALKYLSIVPTGNGHSAIYDARNLSQLVYRLLTRGFDSNFGRVTTWTEY